MVWELMEEGVVCEFMEKGVAEGIQGEENGARVQLNPVCASMCLHICMCVCV